MKYVWKQFKESEGFFYFPKPWIIDNGQPGQWSTLKSSARAILPVIMRFAGNAGQCNPSEETMSALTGCDLKTVRKGIGNLVDMGYMKVEKRFNTKGHRYNVYYEIPKWDYEAGKVFLFYNSVIEGGNWQELPSVAQGVYSVLKGISHYTFEDYQADEDNFESTMAYSEFYKDRKFDIYEYDAETLALFAGVHRTSIKNACECLHRTGLVTITDECRDEYRLIHVLKKPCRHYTREYLNNKNNG